ncbi:MAG: DUF3267 domain-containing protein [Ruminococcaceae bacterium]|nr:DUF3267 domain-containing protein [Oscillospiraceae bacterium]
MNTKKSKNFERELPEGYEIVFHIDAKKKKTGIILNSVAFAISFALGIAMLSVYIVAFMNRESSYFGILLGLLIGEIGTLVYLVVHELTHGAAYKILTGEKLSFGLNWSCAFCGVPNIYVYRKSLLIACLAPFVIYTAILSASIGICFALLAFKVVESTFSLTVIYTALCTVFAMHVGGCSGDVFVGYLLLFKFKDKNVLARDTGPEQIIYAVKKQTNEEKI